MKYTLWDQRYSGREELAQDALLNLFDPSDSLDRQELFRALELVAKTSETPVGKLRPQDMFDEIFYPAPTKNIFRGVLMALKVFDLNTGIEEELAERCKKNNLPIPKEPIMTLEKYIAVWFGLKSKAA